MFFSGADRIGWLSSILVPVMSCIYLILGLLIIILNIGEIPSVISSIMSSAFDFRSIFGGFTGSCMVYGIKRGLFSNEAGMGSAPNASASAEVSHPVKQGLAQVISVYIDTLLICSATVFILLLTGVYKTDSTLNGIPLIQQSVILSKIAVSALKDYEKQKTEGKDPVFCEKNIGLNNTDVWK